MKIISAQDKKILAWLGKSFLRLFLTFAASVILALGTLFFSPFIIPYGKVIVIMIISKILVMWLFPSERKW